MCSVSLSTSLFSLLKLLTGHVVYKGFPCSLVGKESAYNAGDPGSIPGLGRSPGEGKGYSLQYSCLGNLMDRGAWQTTVHEVARVGYDLVIKPPPSQVVYILIYYWLDIFQAVLWYCFQQLHEILHLLQYLQVLLTSTVLEFIICYNVGRMDTNVLKEWVFS